MFKTDLNFIPEQFSDEDIQRLVAGLKTAAAPKTVQRFLIFLLICSLVIKNLLLLYMCIKVIC